MPETTLNEGVCGECGRFVRVEARIGIGRFHSRYPAGDGLWCGPIRPPAPLPPEPRSPELRESL